jgi:hypothetical protein
MDLSYAGELVQTVFFHDDPSIIQSNFKVIEHLVDQLGEACQNKQKNFIWKNVSPDFILQILEEYYIHENSKTANSKLLKEYIEKQNIQGELISWTVALINKAKAKNSHRIGKYDIGLTIRNRDPNRPDVYAIKKGQIISPQDEFIDLNDDEYQEALTDMQNNPDRIDEEKTKLEIPSGPYIRGVRPPERGLLLIYPLDPENANLSVHVPVMGLAFSFPYSEKAVTVRYKVNNVYWEQEFAS